MATRHNHGPRGDKATFTHRGLNFTRHTERDDDGSPPWERGDGHGVVTDWIHADEAPEGARQLGHREGTARYYDLAATRIKAVEERWGLCDADRAALAARLGHDPTDEEVTAEAAERDYRFLNGWCLDEWEYVGVIVTLDGGGRECSASLWGMESNSGDQYFLETACELADQIIEDAGPALEARIAELQQLRATVGAAARKQTS